MWISKADLSLWLTQLVGWWCSSLRWLWKTIWREVGGGAWSELGLGYWMNVWASCSWGRPAPETKTGESSEPRRELKGQARLRMPVRKSWVLQRRKGRRAWAPGAWPAWLGRGGWVCQGNGGEMGREAEGRWERVLTRPAVQCAQARSVMSSWPHGLQPARLLCPWGFPGKNTGGGCHFLVQGIFTTQGSNLHLHVSCIAGGFFTTSAAREALKSSRFLWGEVSKVNCCWEVKSDSNWKTAHQLLSPASHGWPHLELCWWHSEGENQTGMGRGRSGRWGNGHDSFPGFAWGVKREMWIMEGFLALFLSLFEGRRDLEKAMAPHSSTLAWKIPWTEEPGRLQSTGSLEVRHDWATSLSLFTFMHWRRKWQPTPVFLPGESQGRGSLVGCHLWGRTELDTTEAT